LLASLRFVQPSTIHKAATSLMLMTSAFNSGQKRTPMAATGYEVDRDQVVKACFLQPKRIMEERIKEIAGCLPGKVRELWDEAEL